MTLVLLVGLNNIAGEPLHECISLFSNFSAQIELFIDLEIRDLQVEGEGELAILLLSVLHYYFVAHPWYEWVGIGSTAFLFVYFNHRISRNNASSASQSSRITKICWITTKEA